MEQSRFLLSSRLYIIGLSCLLIGIIFVGMALYLLPVVFFDFRLNLPVSFFQILHWMELYFPMTEERLMRVFWILIFLSGILLILFAELSSNYIDKLLLARGRRLRNMEKSMLDIHKILIILFGIGFLLYLAFELILPNLFNVIPKK